jgi:hypothetical protein
MQQQVSARSPSEESTLSVFSKASVTFPKLQGVSLSHASAGMSTHGNIPTLASNDPVMRVQV